jgi:hypothetical protein
MLLSPLTLILLPPDRDAHDAGPASPLGEPAQAPPEPQKDICLHVEAPDRVWNWLERVEALAQAEEARRSR